MKPLLVLAVATAGPAGIPIGQVSRLKAYAQFEARRDTSRRWRFNMTSGHATTEAGHYALLTTLADFLPWPSVLIGHAPRSLVRMPLLDIARAAPPPLDDYLAMRVARVFTSTIVDLNAPGGKPYRWRKENPAEAREQLERHVFRAWLVFLGRAGGPDAEAAHMAALRWEARWRASQE